MTAKALNECVRLVARDGFRFDPAYTSIGGGGKRKERGGQNRAPETNIWMSKQLFVIGHSWGGFMMRSLALEKAAGAVFLNSFLGESHDFKTGVTNPVARLVSRAMMHVDAVYPTSIREWPKPVMLLCGDRDGQMRMSYAAEASHQIDSFRLASNALPEYTQADKSVVVIEGLNHSKHVKSAVPNLERGDMEAAYSTEIAVGKCADAIAAFLDSNQLRSPLARSILRNFESDSRSLMEPMLMAGIGASERGQLRELAQVCQKRTANVHGLTSSQISVREFSDRRLFTYSKPTVLSSAFIAARGANSTSSTQPGMSANDEWRVEVCAMRVLRDTANGGKNNSRNRLGDELWLKMKSQDALMGSPLFCRRAGAPADIKDINEFTLQRALEVVSETARDRFLRRGRPLRFEADIEMAAGPAWLEHPIEYTYCEPEPEDTFGLGQIVVRCPSGMTPAASSPPSPSGVQLPERFAGMQYIKLPSFALMVEYVLVDAFMSIDALPYVSRGRDGAAAGGGSGAEADAKVRGGLRRDAVGLQVQAN